MDQSTHEIRNAQWKSIIEQCQSRTDGTTVAQWCENNGISRKTYYYHLRKFRKEAYEVLKDQKSLPDQFGSSSGISFAEIPIPAHNPHSAPEAAYSQAVAVIKTGNATIAITNEISKEILTTILEAAHA